MRVAWVVWVVYKGTRWCGVVQIQGAVGPVQVPGTAGVVHVPCGVGTMDIGLSGDVRYGL